MFLLNSITHWVICTCLWTYNAAYVYIENRKL